VQLEVAATERQRLQVLLQVLQQAEQEVAATERQRLQVSSWEAQFLASRH
jgi:hypothetical protein